MIRLLKISKNKIHIVHTGRTFTWYFSRSFGLWSPH